MKRIIEILTGILLIAIPFSKDVLNGIFYREMVVLWALIIISIMLLAIIGEAIFNKKVRNAREISISVVDILAGLYLLYGLINLVLVKNGQIDAITVFKWIGIYFGYLLFRLLQNKTYAIYGLIISGILQSLIGIGQKADLLESNHRLFDITGSFGNPGQLGGFLAITLIISIGLLTQVIEQKKWVLAVGFSAGIIVQSIAFYTADSRAAMMGLIIGTTIVFSGCLVSLFRKHKVTFTTVCIAAFICIGCALYNHRPGSADARLLVWRVGADMITDKPIMGHGAGSFNEEYMLYQAEYFKHNPDSRFVLVADNVAYPYNELLHIAIEQGTLGLLIMLALFISAFIYRSKDNIQLIFKAGLATLTVYAMFSYPSYVFPLLFLFAVLLGSLNSKTILRLKIPKWALIPVSAILLVVIGLSILELGFYKVALRNVIQIRTGNIQASKFIDNNFDKLKYNPRFIDIYSMWLSDTEITRHTFDRINDLLPSCEIYCDIGNIYYRSGDYQKAEKYYTIAAHMIPTRIRPNYYRWEIYKETNNTEKAIQTANQILVQPLKIENTFTLRAKAEMKDFLKDVSEGHNIN